LALFTCLSIAKLFGVTYAIDPIFITTLLTIIGYSINDTCVIFNHIREHMKAENTHNIQKVANTAVNKTLSRTLITSLTTFIPVFTLYCFAGAALELLAFSLLWGILWGTYSSVFLATPIACDLDKLFKKITKNNKGSKAAPAPQTKKHK
ncbi:MAG: protein translocase subunit SecDF, partial [Cytophagales bacterium]